MRSLVGWEFSLLGFSLPCICLWEQVDEIFNNKQLSNKRNEQKKELCMTEITREWVEREKTIIENGDHWINICIFHWENQLKSPISLLVHLTGCNSKRNILTRLCKSQCFHMLFPSVQHGWVFPSESLFEVRMNVLALKYIMKHWVWNVIRLIKVVII